MHITRRKFIENASLLAAAMSLPSFSLAALPKKKQNILILGGTNFVGPAVVRALQKAGHQISLFNRGITNPHLFPGLSKISGDRAMGIEGYQNLQRTKERWDLVVDIWPYQPTKVREAIEVLKDKTERYAFISSIAVYNSFAPIGITENAPLRSGEEAEEVGYNLGKVLCEQVVRQQFPKAHIILRPGAIVGARDSGTFTTHVVKRMYEREAIIEPNSNDPVQFIDVKDLARFLNHTVNKEQTGIYNILGTPSKLGYKDMILGIKKAMKSQVKIHWAEPEFLTKEMQLEPFIDIPFWIPVQSDPEPGFYQISNQRAVNQGLRFRKLKKTAQDALDTLIHKKYIVEEDDQSGINPLSATKEKEIIKAWLSKQK